MWNLELQMCGDLRRMRHDLGATAPALAQASQLHAWWHVLVGYASYIQVISLVHNRQT